MYKIVQTPKTRSVLKVLISHSWEPLWEQLEIAHFLLKKFSKNKHVMTLFKGLMVLTYIMSGRFIAVLFARFTVRNKVQWSLSYEKFAREIFIESHNLRRDHVSDLLVSVKSFFQYVSCRRALGAEQVR